MIDFVHVIEEVVGVEAVLGHHAPHGGAVAAIVILLNLEGFILRHVQVLRNEIANPHVHLLPQIDMMRI